MPDNTVYLGFTDAEYKELEDRAIEAKMSIPAYCKSKLIDSEFSKNYKILLQLIERVPLNDEFSIRQLFENDGNRWESISRGTKLALGRHFYSQVHKKIIKTVGESGYGKYGTMFYVKQ